MSTGIHNPFAPKKSVKKKKIDKISIGDVDTEQTSTYIPPTVQLDGGSFVLVMVNVDTIEKATNRLMDLMYQVAAKHSADLHRRGICVGPHLVREDEKAITLGGRQLTVYAPENNVDEEIIYRRIAHALICLPISDILKHNNVQVYERGVS
jgi:hypothetical protein